MKQFTTLRRAALTLLTILLTAATAWAQDTETVTYIDAGIEYTCDDYTVIDEDNMPTELEAGWYVVEGDVTYTSGITFTGEVNFILADGCNMTIGSSSDRIVGNGIAFNGPIDGSNQLHIYGQSGGTGALSIYTRKTDGVTSGDNALSARDIHIHGGNVTADATGATAIYSNSSFFIYGGNVTAHATGAAAIYTNGFNFSHGNVSASADDAYAIHASNYNFGWNAPTDIITIGSGGLDPSGGADFNNTFIDDTGKIYKGDPDNLDHYDGDMNDIVGKALTLRPAVAYIDANGTTQHYKYDEFKLLTGSEPVGNDGTIHIAGGTYFVYTTKFDGEHPDNSNGINFDNTLTLDGDVTLILTSGKTMNVGTSESRINGRGIDTGDHSLTITSQTLGGGMLNIYTSGDGYEIAICAKTLTVNGGEITADADGTEDVAIYAEYAITINRGTVSATATGTDSYGFWCNSNITINGGTVNASGAFTDIGANGGITVNGGNVTANNSGIYTDGDITLGWADPADRIQASSYYADGALTFASLFTDASGNLYGGILTGTDALAALAGVTLQPCAATYIDEDGQTQTTTDYNLLTGTEPVNNGTITLPAGTYVAYGDIAYSNKLRFTGDATLILCDGTTMSVGSSTARINNFGFTSTNNLTIYGQSLGTGALNVYTTGDGCDGIHAGALLTINGGHVTADTDGEGAYALYGGGSVTINGGNVSATASSAIGIFGSVSVNINGGTVNTTGDYDGIGSTGGVTINGGDVTASGGIDGISSEYVDVTIYGGNVTASGDNGIRCFNSNVIINGGNVSATGTTYGIYTENIDDNDDLDWDITINGGTVTATGGTCGICANRNLTLGWTDFTDRITASSYGATGNIAIADGQPFTDADGNTYFSTLFDAEDTSVWFYDLADLNAALAGKTLYPYVENLSLAANQAPDQNYWTTFYCGHTSYQIDANENACAYTATYADGKLTLHRLGKAVPKATAVIIVADNDEVSMYATTLDAFTGNNDLRGVDTDSPVADIIVTAAAANADLAGATPFVLGMTVVAGEQHFGFHRYTATEMPARKAFVLVPAAPGSNASALTMVFDDATGVEEVIEVNGVKEVNDNSWYTLDGRKLNGKPTKPGLYINKGSNKLRSAPVGSEILQISHLEPLDKGRL
jgi:hypothetical protein